MRRRPGPGCRQVNREGRGGPRQRQGAARTESRSTSAGRRRTRTAVTATNPMSRRTETGCGVLRPRASGRGSSARRFSTRGSSADEKLGAKTAAPSVRSSWSASAHFAGANNSARIPRTQRPRRKTLTRSDPTTPQRHRQWSSPIPETSHWTPDAPGATGGPRVASDRRSRHGRAPICQRCRVPPPPQPRLSRSTPTSICVPPMLQGWSPASCRRRCVVAWPAGNYSP